MRHFHDIEEMAGALAAEAEKLGGEIEHRDGGVFFVVKTDCECGAHSVSEVNLTDLASTIWESLS
nr:hypothetical protein [uncultured Shinella sp.]